MTKPVRTRRVPDERRTNQMLLQTALFLIVAILAAGIYLVYYVVSHQGMPSSFQDKVLQETRFAYLGASEDSDAVASYARALISDGQLGEAGRIIDEFRSIEATSASPRVTMEEARIEWMRDNTDEALALMEIALADCEELREARAKSLRSRGISVDPEVPEIIDVALLKADFLESLDRTQEAVTALDHALEEKPTMADVLVRRGGLHATLGDEKKARADYERALQMIPDYAPAIEGLGLLDG
ncbi:MAG: tetratricopeptide repeat protein [Coriobacteriia bacterium]